MILEDTRKKFNTYEIKISMVNLWYCLPVSLIPSSLLSIALSLLYNRNKRTIRGERLLIKYN